MPFTMIAATAARDRLRKADGTCVLLDVRQPEEVRLASVAGAVVIPMMEIPNRLAELDRAKDILVMCHHGMRSQQVADFLARSGYPKVSSVIGGIDAWATTVDATIPRY
jgi:rhodanese-related sulfurtransferase